MSVSTVSTDSSVVWTIHRFNPSPPAQPPNYNQFDDGGDTAAVGTDTGSAPTSGQVDDGRARIGADLNALLLDLQGTQGSTGATPGDDAPGTTAASGTTTASATSGTGGVSADLKTFSDDLAGTSQAGGTGAVGHRRHHGPPPPPPDGSGNVAGTTASGTTTSAGDTSSSPDALLSYVVKALQRYGTSGAAASGTTGIGLSA